MCPIPHSGGTHSSKDRREPVEVACGEEEEAANRPSLLGYQKTNGP